MDDLKAAELKDRILIYLHDQTSNKKAYLKHLYKVLKPEDVSKEVFETYAADLVEDKAIQSVRSGGDSILALIAHGERILHEGGYMIGYMKRIVKELQSDMHDLKERTKLDMEIKDLINRLKDYKWTRIRSWIAICISLAAVVISILVLIFK